MLRTDLLALIKNGEGSRVEFKRDDLHPRDLAKELVAFANLQGGAVLLGVEDDGSVSGVQRSDLETWVMNVCRDKIRPALIPTYEVVVDAEPGKDVAVIGVEPGYAVASRWHDNHHTYFIRVGSESREMDTPELERLMQQRGSVRAELRPLTNAGVDELDLRRLDDYFGRVRRQTAPDAGDLAAWEQLLVNTELMAETDRGIVATLAGMALFGRRVSRFLPQSAIAAAAYPGVEKDYETVGREQLDSPLVGLFTRAGELAEPGLVEEALGFIERTTGAEFAMSGGRRVTLARYPEDAVREGAVNALVHRDYLLHGSDIEMSVYADRVEIVSPGRLPNGITPARMLAGTRASRNQLIKDVMRDYGYMEHMGMGIPFKIVRSMHEHNGTEPELIEDGERFTLVLRGQPS